jgi:hypothetical protein
LVVNIFSSPSGEAREVVWDIVLIPNVGRIGCFLDLKATMNHRIRKRFRTKVSATYTFVVVLNTFMIKKKKKEK